MSENRGVTSGKLKINEELTAKKLQIKDLRKGGKISSYQVIILQSKIGNE
jgi:hypothetical protein